MNYLRRLVWFLLLLILIGGVWLLVTALPSVLEARRIGENRAAAEAQFGDLMLSRCDTLARPAQTKLPKLKVVFVNAVEKTLNSAYNNALAPERRAATADELEGLVCLKPAPATVDVYKYAESASDPNPYYCTMIRRDLEAYLLDAKTGQPLAFRLLEGGEPPACPSSRASGNLSLEGDWPAPADAVKWLNGP